MSAFDQCQMLVSPKQFLIVPPRAAAEQGHPGLRISRPSGSIALCQDASSLAAEMTRGGAKKMTIYGVVGVASVPNRATSFLLVLRRKIRVGVVMGRHTVWRHDGVEIISIRPKSARGGQDDADEKLVKGFIVQVLGTPYFYFSYDLDLTQTQQRLFLSQNDDASVQRPLLERADSRFVWNDAMLQPFVRACGNQFNNAVHSFLLPMIHGAVFINKCEINGKGVTWSVISRRSRHRVGTRFFVRGCDKEGNAANFVETEQLVEYAGAVSSFVQTRGSMPMFWQQYPNIKYKPKPTMVEGDSLAAFLAHFKEQLPIYGEQVIVNLVDQKKAEGEMELELKNLVREAGLSAVHYVAFDFHTECKNMKFQNLVKLVRQLQPYQSDHEYFFLANGDPATLKRQKGVFRTNCMDCLDRTNVVQSLLATENLKTVFKRMGVLGPNDDIMAVDVFQNIYRNVWADHADLISIQYAGTGALKTDFTRTGQRTYRGMLADGWNAINRYYLNNFLDGDRTDANRFFVGEVTPEEYFRARSDLSRLRRERPTPAVVTMLPAVLLAVLAVAAFTLLHADALTAQVAAFLVLCAAVAALVAKLIVDNGLEFVNKPVTSPFKPKSRKAAF